MTDSAAQTETRAARGRSRLRPIAVLLAVLAAVALVLAFAVSAYLTRGVELVQRVEPAGAAASLFGDAGTDTPGTPIGSPQRMMIRDERAYLPGEGPGGARLVSEAYLREQGIYPLQEKTVHFVRDMVLLGALGALLLAGVLWWWGGRRMNMR